MSNTNSKPVTTPKNQDNYNLAISKGKEVLTVGGSKAEACRAIYELIKDESREVIIQSFIEGGSVTEKGSPTYYYNVKRQVERKHREEGKRINPKKKKSDIDTI